MLPLLDLAHQLALRSVSITVLVTPKNLPILSPLLSTHPSIQTLVLPFPTHPNIPPGVENVKDLPVSGFRTMMFALGELLDPILEWFKSHPSPPTAVVYDFFLGWAHNLCRRAGVPGYSFSPSGALALVIIYSLWSDRPKKRLENGNDGLITFSKVPKCPSYPWWQLSNVYRSFVENEVDPISKFIETIFVGNLSSYGVILNTFSESEMIYLDYLKELLGHERVWAVGPLLPTVDDVSGPGQRGGSTSVSGDEVSKWLDKCEDDSVVYVCFGSQAVLTNEQMEALANGLEKSGVKFVWCYKGATKGHVDGKRYGSIPSGFEDRVAGRGLVIKGWAPQVLILRHPAVGAFLTHCGWNSVLESILLGGVPMLTWPMGADQFMNASLIVDELKIGMRVCAGEGTVPDSDEMARVLAKASEDFEKERSRAVELHKAALGAVREKGSSFESLNNLVAHFGQKLHF